MNTFDTYPGVFGEAFTQARDEYIEAAAHEIVIITPKAAKQFVTANYSVDADQQVG